MFGMFHGWTSRGWTSFLLFSFKKFVLGEKKLLWSLGAGSLLACCGYKKGRLWREYRIAGDGAGFMDRLMFSEVSEALSYVRVLGGLASQEVVC